MKKQVYIDRECPENQGISYAVLEQEKPIPVIYAGKVMNPMPVTDRKEKSYHILAKYYDIHFIFEDQAPAPEFYPVPSLELFAFDSEDGYFGATSFPELDGKAPVYYIDHALHCYYLGGNLREFLSMAVFYPDWKKRFRTIAPENSCQPEHKTECSLEDRNYLIERLQLRCRNFPDTEHIPEHAEIKIYASIHDAKMEIEFLKIPFIQKK